MTVKVITAITGDKDAPRKDIPCFTGEGKFTNPVMEAKIYKVLIHQYADCDYSIWIDGNIHLLISPERLVKEWMGNKYDLAVWKHFARDCVYEEMGACSILFPELKDTIQEQFNAYKEKGYPEHNGLAECNVIIRKHSKKMEKFNNSWWSEICRWSQRDQLSFPYCLSNTSLRVNFIDGNVRNHPYFIYNKHNK